MHLALKHQKLADFVPKDVASVLYIQKKPKDSVKKPKETSDSGSTSSPPQSKSPKFSGQVSCVRCKTQQSNKGCSESDEHKIFLPDCDRNFF